MQAAFLASFLANVMLTLLSMLILPERVAIHFGLGGLPYSRASNLTEARMPVVPDAPRSPKCAEVPV